jgi:1,4-dihydroxy-2-naphthoate octaprenyltransferase
MRATLIKHMQNIVNDYYKYKRGFTGPDLTKPKRGKK